VTLKLIHADLMALRYCNRGSRQVCLRYNVDWGKFLQEGLPLEQAEQIDDEMIRAAVREAKRRQGVA
jgi:hypothetical protein